MHKIITLILVSGLLTGIPSLHAADDHKSPINLALNRPVKSFSSLGDLPNNPGNKKGQAPEPLPPAAKLYEEAFLTDGQQGAGAKYWSSGAFASFPDHRLYPEWIVVDLGKHYRVQAVHLFPRADAALVGQGFPVDFTIQVSREGEGWTTIVEKQGYAQPTNGAAQKFEFSPCVVRFVKVEATRLRPVAGNLGAHYFQLTEVEVVGSATADPVFVTPPVPALTPAAASNLRCEYRVNPVGVDALLPHLSWTMEGTGRGQKQTAFRVLVASNRAELDANHGTLWDSGRIESDQSVAVEYAGKTLGSGTLNFWKVMLWDKDARPTDWSQPAQFVMGKLQTNDWLGQWIGASQDPQHHAVYLRKEIAITKPVRRATAFFCGLGWSELSIEGKKVSDWVLSPGFTTYHMRTQYLTFDVTDFFGTPGRKALGVVLGDGWYALEKDPWVHRFEKLPYVDKPKLLLDIELEFADGSTQTISSDTSWKWGYGPITKNWVGLENIDLRQSLPGWDQTNFNDSTWSPVAIVAGPKGKLVTQKEPPARILETFKPQRLRQDIKTGAWIYEFGRQFQGWPTFRTAGPAGTIITLIVHPTSGGTKQGNQFILSGQGVEEYAPRFNYNAVSKVEIHGLTQLPALADLTGCHVNDDLADAGQFRCSDDTMNWLNESFRRTMLSYCIGAPNDPTREKKTWSNDFYNLLFAAIYHFDSQALFARWAEDFDGQSPCITPGLYYDNYNDWWLGGTVVWNPWNWYQIYGDRRLLAQMYPAMKKYVDALTSQAKDHIVSNGLGEWNAPGRTSTGGNVPSKPLVVTAGYYYYARIVNQAAAELGQAADAKRYADLAAAISESFNAKYLDRTRGRYTWTDPNPDPVTGKPVNSQGVHALALGSGLVPEDLRPGVEKSLLEDIADRNGHLDAGFACVPHLVEVLARINPQVGQAMALKRDFPSWYGMTAGSNNDLLNENWNGQQVLMPGIGCDIAKWHFRSLAGILHDESGPGFKKFILRPNVAGDLHWVKCHYDSVHGRIVSNWQRRGRQFVWEVVIPANTTATVHLPADNADTVLENGKPLKQVDGVRVLRTESGRAVLACVAGTYHFSSTLPLPERNNDDSPKP